MGVSLGEVVNHGYGVLEVTCPFTCKAKDFQSAANYNSNSALYR